MCRIHGRAGAAIEGIRWLPLWYAGLAPVLRLLVDQILVDKDNKVSITLGIPTDSLMSIEKMESHSS